MPSRQNVSSRGRRSASAAVDPLKSLWFLRARAVALQQWQWWKKANTPVTDHFDLPMRAVPWILWKFKPNLAAVFVLITGIALSSMFKALEYFHYTNNEQYTLYFSSYLFYMLPLTAVVITFWIVKQKFLKSRGVPVLRASWFFRQNPVRFPRMQDVPAEAFAWSSECRSVLFVSHRWESQQHPDPSNMQASLLALFLANTGGNDGINLDDIGIWYDYSVLPQDPRNILERIAFPALLKSLTIVQNSSHTVICGISSEIQDYSERGWCVLESYVGLNKQTISYAKEGKAVAEFATVIYPSWDQAVGETLATCCFQFSKGDGGESLFNQLWTCQLCSSQELDIGLEETRSIPVKNHIALKCAPDAVLGLRLRKILRLVQQRNRQDEAPLSEKRENNTKFSGLVRNEYNTCWGLLQELHHIHVSQSSHNPDEHTHNLPADRANQLLLPCKRKLRLFEATQSEGTMHSVAEGRVPVVTSAMEVAIGMNLKCTSGRDIKFVLEALQEQFHTVLTTACTMYRSYSQDDGELKFLAANVMHCMVRRNSSGLLNAFMRLVCGNKATNENMGDVHSLCTIADEFGRTPAHVAASIGALHSLTVLHTWYPSLLCTEDNRGWTPIHEAAASGEGATAIKMLAFLRKSMSVSQWQSMATACDEEDRTILHLAAIANDSRVITMLAKAFPDMLESYDMMGRTPLHSAAADLCGNAINTLVALHPDPESYIYMEDDDEATAWDLCSPDNGLRKNMMFCATNGADIDGNPMVMKAHPNRKK